MNNKLGVSATGLTETQKKLLKKLIVGMMKEDESKVNNLKKLANTALYKQREAEEDDAAPDADAITLAARMGKYAGSPKVGALAMLDGFALGTAPAPANSDAAIAFASADTALFCLGAMASRLIHRKARGVLRVARIA